MGGSDTGNIHFVVVVVAVFVVATGAIGEHDKLKVSVCWIFIN